VNKHVILIVDDETRVLFVLKNALSRLGDSLKVITADTGQDALGMMAEERCDLVITDLIMPDMDGVELTRQIRAREESPAIVWMTAYGCQSFVAEIEKLGVYQCVEKPVEIAQIRQVAREALGQAALG